MSEAQQKRPSRKRADTLLIFDPAQKIPESVLNAIVDEWLAPGLVQRFIVERGKGCAPDVSHFVSLSPQSGDSVQQ